MYSSEHCQTSLHWTIIMLNRNTNRQIPPWDDPGESSFSLPNLAQRQLEVPLCITDIFHLNAVCLSHLKSCLDDLQENLRHKFHPFTSLCCTLVSSRGAALNNIELFMTCYSLPVCSAQLHQRRGGSVPKTVSQHKAFCPFQENPGTSQTAQETFRGGVCLQPRSLSFVRGQSMV